MASEAEPIGFSLTEPIEMDPAQNDFAEEDAQGFWQFLVEFEHHGLLQEILQFHRMTRIECASSGTEYKGSNDSLTAVLPQTAPARGASGPAL